MSIFGDLDVASASDNPFEVPPNTYAGYVTDCKTGLTKDESKFGMTLEYTVEGGDYDSRKVTEWKWIPRGEDKEKFSPAEISTATSYLKQRMLSLGVPESRMNSVTPEDLVGTPVNFTVKEGKKGYLNITRVEVRGEGDSAQEFSGFASM